MFGSTYFPTTVVLLGSVTSTICMSFQPAKYAYVSPSGVVATCTSAFPFVVSGLKSSCSILSVPTMCWEALEWSCPSCWNNGSSLSEITELISFSEVSSPEKTYIALDTIKSTRKKVSAISLPRMLMPILMPVLTLCDDGLA